MQLKYLVLALGAFASVGLANVYGKGRPSSVGTWIRNDQESFNLPNPVKDESVVIRRDDSILDYTWTGVDADGKKMSFTFSGAVDGKPQAATGDFEGMRVATAPTLTAVHEGKIWNKDGSSESKYCIPVSATRLTCYATYIDSKGKESLFREVFDKKK
jgi:hypothetical protein